ncbi:MAG: DUF5615 family PIN-like protein [Verrucomicrobia bacterium]|nr:DUF5615 family PIN-like protein [Verrucomicrobiota bacterium]
MTLWVDAQMPPRVARWLREKFPVEAFAIRELGLRNAPNVQILESVHDQPIVVMTKDPDLVELVKQRGAPPQILWMTCEGATEQDLREILSNHFSTALSLLESGEPIVEIS